MKRKILGLAVFAVASLALAQGPAASPAGPGEPGRGHGDRFAESDANHDGKITLAEWQQAAQARQKAMFERLDGNHDGALTEQELRQAKEQRREAMRERRERVRGNREKLRELDADHDLQLSRAEIGEKMPRLSENFERLDGNHDGKLSRDEIRAGRKDMAGGKE